ncbi:D-alanine--poly(phosphoribitol) ligase subunit DltA [Staphylococcus durrellii]|uniref:D-alanine--poly(phosphoribitol) ligase subunit DltA n=1 Tax=Staphylococcus durrellii TaxID=2781773 RepID=UPI00189E910B|nr:D-alanine--poly(phosphoribitol) ligase subunit DltA [Staphylococcus durrellii]MBF7017553.1 D-alanine--poly(phosphoribitol) ligase subunit DltA [Staphylococcus durrellii]
MDIINLVKQHATFHPDQDAVKYNDNVLTYKDIEQYSNTLAKSIENTDKPLLLYGHMSPFMIVGMLASIKAGCGYVPVDTSLPEDRVASIVKKIEPQYIFNTTTESINLNLGTEIFIEVLREQQPIDNYQSQIASDDIAYTIFTSGSTGEPKGVQIKYSSLNEFAEWIIELNQAGEHQQWLNQAPFSFDLSVMAIYPCLISAGTLNLVDKTMINKPKLLNDLLENNDINIWVSTPSFLEMCLLLPHFDQQKYPKLKQFYFCGEILAHKTASILNTKFPQAIIYNTYGPTEATVAITSIQITKDVIDRYNPLPVGVPKNGTALDVTEEGELVITGNCVSVGYFKDEVRSMKAFKDKGDNRSYYTGDKAIEKDGLWFVQGRIDYQIKLNGYRIELEEIEFQLRHLDAIREAIVVPIYNKDKVSRIVGVITLNQEIQEDYSVNELSHEIKEQLKHHIPAYMIPSKFKVIDLMPMTVNGKVDRRQIAEVIT